MDDNAMKLHYMALESGNVGDDLNPWLWPKVLGDVFDDVGDHLFLGIGSILNDRLPETAKYTVVGTGVAGAVPDLGRGAWDILALRGPLSEQRLGLGRSVALLDGAYLVTKFFQPTEARGNAVGYVPHHLSAAVGLWDVVCQKAEVTLLDPRWPVERFLVELCRCDRVISEAMHGAILADAYDIPWLPAKIYDFTTEFKWRDWGASLSLEFEFSRIPCTWRGEAGLPIRRRLVNDVKRAADAFGLFPSKWTPVAGQRKPSDRESIDAAVDRVKELSQSAGFMLSDESGRYDRIDVLWNVLHDHFADKERRCG